MKKSSFVALVLGTVSGLLFSIGMCMALIPEWKAFESGVAMGAAGMILGIVTLLVWRKMTNRVLLQLNIKNLGPILVGISGALLLGLAMCFVMVWNNLVLGILVGIGAIALMLCMIPMVAGFKD